MRYGFVILYLLFLSPAWSQTESLITRHYTTKEGLSNNTVYCITRDSRGFLWLGTKEGLNRFDGLQFKKYFSEKNNPYSLPHDNIFDVLEYQFGQLLIATVNGLAVLNTLTGEFENEKIRFPQLQAGSGTVINSMYKDKQANIWINHDGELDILDSNLVYQYRFTNLNWAKSLKGVLIRFERWFTDRNNRIWLPSDTSGIHIIDFATKNIFSSKNNPQQIAYLKSQSIRAFLNDEENNTLWYAPWGEGLFRFNLLTGEWKQVLFGINKRGEERTINSITKTKKGDLLCFIKDRCYEINITTFRYKLIPEKSSFDNRGNQAVACLTINNHGNDQYLFGSGHGLYHLSGEKTPYREMLLIKPGSTTSLKECSDMIISRSGRLYCTYNNNLLVAIEKTREDFSHYLLSGHPNTIFTEVCEDHLNRIWIGSQNGIWLFDPVKNKYTRPDFLAPEFLNLDINIIYCDREGDIWIAARNPFCLYQYNARNNRVQQIKNPVTAHFEGLGENSRISEIAEDKQGHLWMSSRLGGGIIYYNKKNDLWKLYPPSGSNSTSLANKGLVSMYPGDNNFLWLSSYFGDGLGMYNYKNDSLRQFTRHDGLLGNYILNIVSDKTGTLYLTTENGITKFTPGNFRIKANTIFKKPVSSDDQQTIFDPLTNSLIIGQDNSLLLIPVDSSLSTAGSPLPLIDRVMVNNEQQFFEPGLMELKLSPEQKNISIDFTAIHFANADKINFAYRLTGVDKDWRMAEANRTAQYAILSPGTYTFTLKAADETGVWSQTHASFTFTIAQPWWQNIWYRVAVILIFTGLITWFVRKRIKLIRHEAELKQKISETEMMALRSQMNPHFIFNCLNAIDNLIQTNQKEKATTYLARFAKLIRNVLDSSKNNTVLFQKDMESLNLYLQIEQFRCNNKFEYELQADPELLHSDYKIPPLVVQPFVENAIHHGLLNKQTGDRKLTIVAKLENNYILYSIIDTGVGRARAGELKELNNPDNQSYGIDITRERLHLHNQNGKSSDIKITDLYTDNNPAGTKVEIRVKIYDQT